MWIDNWLGCGNQQIYNIYDLETSYISILNMALSIMTVLHWTEAGTAHGGVNPGAHGGDSAVEAVLCILATIWLQINVFITPIKETLEVRLLSLTLAQPSPPLTSPMRTCWSPSLKVSGPPLSLWKSKLFHYRIIIVTIRGFFNEF